MHYDRHLQQTTFENNVTKGEIAQNVQFLLLSHFFQLNSIVLLAFIGIFHIFRKMLSKSSAAELSYEGKG